MLRFIFCCIAVTFPLPIQAEETPRAEILRKMQLVMGPLPGNDQIVPLAVELLEEKRFDTYLRKKITFASEQSDRVPAYLLVPLKFEGKRPAMLCLHQTIAIGKGEPVGLNQDTNKHYALELVQLGYVCIVPDYPSFGDYAYDFKKSKFVSGSMKAIWNNLRAVDLLQSLPEVDGKRIGAIGHSLGGHNAIFTAVFDERIQVIVSCCGFCSFSTYYGGNLKGWTSDRYMPRIASMYQSDPKKMPFDFTDLVASLAPRSFLAIAPIRDSNFDVKGVKAVMEYAKPVYDNQKSASELQAIYPDAAHDFPSESRKAAYEFINRRLKP